jgi:microcystin-dependent protein
MQYVGSAAPDGFLLCDGTAVSRTSYAALFNLINTQFGAGDGSTTFNLPDLRGRVPLGAGTGPGLSARVVGNASGTETHQLSVDEMPSHGHNVVDNQHSHNMNWSKFGAATGNLQTLVPPSVAGEGSQASNLAPASISLGNAGGNLPHNNMQPFLVMNYIIRY